ncbi:MAG: GNAT family N-acetyltransferase [Chloroflexi bacterium]|nr:GNAT family N-acetyltransferase [Chloroflexota bacterium]MDA1239241.1 GNAT family N-acetyltransferase [Chloroflexota bacterium]
MTERAFDPASEVLRTERLDLLLLPLEFCEAILAGERERASAVLGYPLGEWPFGDEIRLSFPGYVERLRVDPLVAVWQGRAVVVRETGEIAGGINLKGRPARVGPLKGRVEIGYGLEPPWRHRGYAREAARALVARAFLDPDTREVTAVIDPSNAASIAVAESVGMHGTGELSSRHTGSYVWVVTRERFKT